MIFVTTCDSECFCDIAQGRYPILDRLAGTVVLKLAYDHEVVSEDDFYVALADRALKGLLQVVHVGSNMVDVIPILKYIPGIFK